MLHSCWEMAKKQPTCTGHCTNGMRILTPSMREPHMEAQDVLVGCRESPWGGLVNCGSADKGQLYWIFEGHLHTTHGQGQNRKNMHNYCITTQTVWYEKLDANGIQCYSCTVCVCSRCMSVWQQISYSTKSHPMMHLGVRMVTMCSH